METKYVKISVKELKRLLKKEVELAALDCSGVDNWEYYGEAFSSYLEFDNKYDNWDDFIETEFSDEQILKMYDEVK